jgi:hypothetical protein
VSARAIIARAPRSPRPNSRRARRSGHSDASSPRPLTACSSPLKIRRLGANEYMRKWSPPSTPTGGGASKAPSARWAALRQRGTSSARDARASAEIAVAWLMPLIQGAVPPPQWKKCSQARKPPRREASASRPSTERRSCATGQAERRRATERSCRHMRASQLTLPQLASGWSCMPRPG